jgi:hypothetical protein
LLDWLERQLDLRWLESEAVVAAPAVKPPGDWTWPDAATLEALQQDIQLGYYRGIMNRLDALETAKPECAAFVAAMRELARQFQFEAMSSALGKAPVLEEKP